MNDLVEGRYTRRVHDSQLFERIGQKGRRGSGFHVPNNSLKIIYIQRNERTSSLNFVDE